MRLGKNILNDVTMHVGETKVATLIAVSQPGVIYAQQMKDRGVKVMNVHGARSPLVLVRLDHVAILVRQVVSIIVRLPVGNAWLDSSTRHPGGESPRVMIATIVFFGQLALAVSCSTKFPTPDYKCVLKHASLL